TCAPPIYDELTRERRVGMRGQEVARHLEIGRQEVRDRERVETDPAAASHRLQQPSIPCGPHPVLPIALARPRGGGECDRLEQALTTEPDVGEPGLTIDVYHQARVGAGSR